MGASHQFLTTKEFAAQSGLTVSKVTRLLREGGLQGQKEGRKWVIPASELDALQGSPRVAKRPATPPQPTRSAAPAAPKTGSGQSYSVSEFSEMTYLTEIGVHTWLKKGRLKGTQTAEGEWRIDAANLEIANIKRLVR